MQQQLHSLQFFGEWMILILACSIALFFIPLTPSFTLHSTTSTVLNVTDGKTFTANLGVEFLAEHSNTIGSTIHYDYLHLSLFHHQENLSTFSISKPFYNKHVVASIQEAKFRNVSMMIDGWKVHGIGEACGLLYLDLRFRASARYIQPMWPVMKDKLVDNCGEMKVEMCDSGSSVVVNPFLASCDVYNDLVTNVRIALFGMLIFLLVIAVAVPLIVEHFFCSANFS
ncbi:transmembrane protein, putative [Medicago truncatula]|uniref:Transmembrane protein, putative n=1 Tax=Medicago truncatula TaxID=3880 RepID=A0A072UK79_MEDTR|nr:transmembrane protein, putative [Medicago truncatula]